MGGGGNQEVVESEGREVEGGGSQEVVEVRRFEHLHFVGSEGGGRRQGCPHAPGQGLRRCADTRLCVTDENDSETIDNVPCLRLGHQAAHRVT